MLSREQYTEGMGLPLPTGIAACGCRTVWQARLGDPAGAGWHPKMRSFFFFFFYWRQLGKATLRRAWPDVVAGRSPPSQVVFLNGAAFAPVYSLYARTWVCPSVND